MDLSWLPGFREAGPAVDLSSSQQDMTRYPGGQQDALRHALWSSMMAQRYGRLPAIAASTGLEGLEQLQNALHPTRSWDDRKRVWDESVADFKNNLVGANTQVPPEQLVRVLRAAPLEALPPYWDNKNPK